MNAINICFLKKIAMRKGTVNVIFTHRPTGSLADLSITSGRYQQSLLTPTYSKILCTFLYKFHSSVPCKAGINGKWDGRDRCPRQGNGDSFALSLSAKVSGKYQAVPHPRIIFKPLGYILFRECIQGETPSPNITEAENPTSITHVNISIVGFSSGSFEATVILQSFCLFHSCMFYFPSTLGFHCSTVGSFLQLRL